MDLAADESFLYVSGSWEQHAAPAHLYEYTHSGMQVREFKHSVGSSILASPVVDSQVLLALCNYGLQVSSSGRAGADPFASRMTAVTQ